MDVVECIEGRTSVRSFKADPVDDEIVVQALTMANLAPSAGNLQARDFIIVRSAKTKKLLMEAALNQDFIATAPVVVVCCANLERIKHYGERGERLYCLQDTAAAIENMLLFLHSKGLGTVWVGAFNERKTADALELPSHIRPIAMVAIGVPSGRTVHRSRLPTGSLTHYEKW